MSYNLANQMTSALGNSYIYDGHNRRVKVAGNGDTRYYLYSQSGQLLFSEENGVQTNYIYLGGKLIAEDSQGVTTFVHSDMLGSPVARTNATGTVQSRRHYKPFGDTYETPSYDIGYTGHKYDDDLGLSYMQARYYDPVIGRFYSNDPKDTLSFISEGKIQGFNRYAYAANNPYKYTDPDGKDYVSAFISIDIPFVGGVDVGAVQFTKDVMTGRGETDIGLFVTVSKPTDDGLGLVDTTGIGGATIGAGKGSNTRSTFDGTNASIKAGVGVATIGAGGLLNSSQDKSLTAEVGPSIGLEGYQEQTFSITAGDVIDTVKGWFSESPKEDAQ
ncbi:RHS repeat-associated core domain-containing protein [Pseudidiomarina piscicola]|nr:RHS repeat-associated core domain-containing protein [Pseudidiomarina piscicola]